jgi:hypothetical protein
MKKRKLIVLLACTLLAGVLLTGCTDQNQEDAVKGVKKGLESRFKIEQTTKMTPSQYIETEQSAIDSELTSVKKYQKKEFKHDEFKKDYKALIQSLKNEKKGIQYFGKDADKYNTYYVKGANAHAKLMKKFSDEYGLTVSKDYSPEFKEAKKKAPEMIKSNERVRVNSKYGMLDVLVEGVEESNEWTEYADDEIQKNERFALLKLQIKNISYSDKENPGYVSFEDLIPVQNLDGVQYSAFSATWDYGGYAGAAGAYVELSKGRTKKVVTGYPIEKDVKYVKVQVGNKIWVGKIQPE